MSSLRAFRSRETPLSRATRDLKELKKSLENLNTQFPQTRAFLYKKGLTHVSQLDREGMKELREYLQGVYRGSLH